MAMTGSSHAAPVAATRPTAITTPSEAGGTRVVARRFVVATGSSPRVPPIPGIDATPYLTNETIFDLGAVPAHLIIVGGGPIGVELAQAHRQLGARVKVLASVLTSDPWSERDLTFPDVNTLTRNAAKLAYDKAGIGPADLDLPTRPRVCVR